MYLLGDFRKYEVHWNYERRLKSINWVAGPIVTFILN